MGLEATWKKWVAILQTSLSVSKPLDFLDTKNMQRNKKN